MEKLTRRTASAGNTESKGRAAFARFVVAGFAVIALVAAQLVLSAAIRDANYGGGDGKLAQATILTAYKFASFLQFNVINPTQGLGSQLLPMNVWVNPAYWPFAFLPKELATDVSAAIALGIFVIAGYIMARCFDAPVVPSAVGAQLSIIMFAPAAFIFQLATVFCIMTGNAVVYARAWTAAQYVNLDLTEQRHQVTELNVFE